jgi:hypothetical protein
VQIAPELRLEAAAARNGEEKVLGRNVQITISLMGYLWGIMRIGIKAIVKWCFGGDWGISVMCVNKRRGKRKEEVEERGRGVIKACNWQGAHTRQQAVASSSSS